MTAKKMTRQEEHDFDADRYYERAIPGAMFRWRRRLMSSTRTLPSGGLSPW